MESSNAVNTIPHACRDELTLRPPIAMQRLRHGGLPVRLPGRRVISSIELIREAEGRDVCLCIQLKPVSIVVSILPGEGVDTRSKGKSAIPCAEVRVAVLASRQPVSKDVPFNSPAEGPAVPR